MIPVHMEPKGLRHDAIPLASDYPQVSLAAAYAGSALLRDAILRAKGIVPPPVKKEPRPLPVRITRAQAQRAVLCPTCHAPFKPSFRFIAQIQQTVSAYFGIDAKFMLSAERRYSLSHPRQIAMYLARELSLKSLPDIGRRFNKDHTTVMYAIKAVQKRIAEDPEEAFDVAFLRERLAA